MVVVGVQYGLMSIENDFEDDNNEPRNNSEFNTLIV